MENKDEINYLKDRLKDNGGKWLGYKFGRNNEIVVRIRRSGRRYFYLIVDEYIGENKVIVRDAKNKEQGVAIRFDRDSFTLEPILNSTYGKIKKCHGK